MGHTIRIFLLLFLSNALLAQPANAEKYLGDWEGEIELPKSAKLGVIFHIGGSSKAMNCMMEVPAQGASEVPAEKIYLKDDQLYIEYPMLKAKYLGTLKAGTINGTWSQNGMEFPLNLSPYTGIVEKVEKMQTPKPPFNYDINEMELAVSTKSGQHQLSGTITTPRGDGPYPLAILVSGSGPQDRDETIFGHKPFWVIADYLTNNGIAVMRYDDRGTGKSTGDFASATTEDFLSDAMFLVNSMGVYPNIDKEKIGIIGHSEGGLIAAMAAAKSNKVKFTIMLAGPGVPGHQILKKQLNLIQKAEGVEKELIEKEAQPMSDMIDIAMGEGDNKERAMKANKVLKTFYENNLSVEEKKVYGDKFDNYFQTKTAGLFTNWMHYFLNTEPKKYLEKISCPVLAMVGTNDLQVPAMDNIPALEAALNAAPTESYVVKEIPGVNHLFQHSRTGKTSEYGMLEETFANEVLVMMRDWIKGL